MLHNPAFYSRSPGGVDIHPAVTEYANRIATEGGTIDQDDINVINNFLRTLVNIGLVEFGLTSGQTTSASVLREIYPIAGNDVIAAECKLLYMSGTGGRLGRNNITPTYTRTGGISPGGTLSSSSRITTGVNIPANTQNVSVSWMKEVSAGNRGWGVVNGTSYCQSTNAAMLVNGTSSAITSDRVGEPATGFICAYNNNTNHRVFRDGAQQTAVTRPIATADLNGFAIFNSVGSTATPSTSQRYSYFAIGMGAEMPAAQQSAYSEAVYLLRYWLREWNPFN